MPNGRWPMRNAGPRITGCCWKRLFPWGMRGFRLTTKLTSSRARLVRFYGPLQSDAGAIPAHAFSVFNYACQRQAGRPGDHGLAVGRKIVANAGDSLDPVTLAKSGIQLANVYRNLQLTMDQGMQLFQ